MTSFIATSIFIFILGTILGSFFNVCIHRLPRGESIVRPSSHCPSCQKKIAWYDNIPIVSLIALGGRCRHCGARITVRYLIVELVTGFFYLWIWLYFGRTIESLICAILFSLLMIATVVDLEHQIIPDEVSLGGLGAGVLLSALIPSIHGETIWWRGLLDALIGAVIGGAMIYITGVLGDLVFRKESMGGGDVKLLAMIGTFVGWQKVVLVYLIAPILALPLGLFLKFARRQDVLPYGPFLSLAGWIGFLWGDRLMALYWYGMMY